MEHRYCYLAALKQSTIADFGSNRILRVDPLGIVTTVAGTGVASYSEDGYLATSATLNSPASVVVDPAENLYIAVISILTL